MPATDPEGYLLNYQDWNPTVANELARAEGMALTAAHWEIIELLRSFYQQFEISPATRPLVKYVRQQLGEDKGRSIYLMKLFKASPAKLAAKLAGLPKPPNCL